MVIQSNNNAMYTGSFASPPKIISVMPESGRQEGLLTMAYAPGTSPDEMSFSDAFEHAAVEWITDQPPLCGNRLTGMRVR